MHHGWDGNTNCLHCDAVEPVLQLSIVSINELVLLYVLQHNCIGWWITLLTGVD